MRPEASAPKSPGFTFSRRTELTTPLGHKRACVQRLMGSTLAVSWAHRGCFVPLRGWLSVWLPGRELAFLQPRLALEGLEELALQQRTEQQRSRRRRLFAQAFHLE